VAQDLVHTRHRHGEVRIVGREHEHARHRLPSAARPCVAAEASSAAGRRHLATFLSDDLHGDLDALGGGALLL